jgi:hypothetical protein
MKGSKEGESHAGAETPAGSNRVCCIKGSA